MRSFRLRARLASRTRAGKIVGGGLRSGCPDWGGVEAAGIGCSRCWHGLPGFGGWGPRWRLDGPDWKASGVAHGREVACAMC